MTVFSHVILLWIKGTMRELQNVQNISHKLHLAFCIACGFLVPRPRIKPEPLQWEQCLNHWTPREVLDLTRFYPTSEGRQNENHNHRKLIKLMTWTTALSNSMKLCCVGPPKMHGSWWRVLIKCGPLEKGIANHFSILALRTPWTVWKDQKIWHWNMNSLGLWKWKVKVYPTCHRKWDGWMASPTQWTWVWASSRSWWRAGNPGMLQSMGSQRVGHSWATELNWTAFLNNLLYRDAASISRKCLKI